MAWSRSVGPSRGRGPDLSVSILEKEDAVGKHATGWNSGVLHPGFYSRRLAPFFHPNLS